jgi:hypothetical protein
VTLLSRIADHRTDGDMYEDKECDADSISTESKQQTK